MDWNGNLSGANPVWKKSYCVYLQW